MPLEAKSLKYIPDINFYTPQPDKFLMYSQLPRPRCAPYFNEINSVKLNRKKAEFVKSLEKDFIPENTKNGTLFKYKTNRDISLQHLSGTLTDMNMARNTGRVRKLADKSFCEEVEVSQGGSKILGGTVKIVNNREINEPNTLLFTRQMEKISDRERERQIEEEKKMEEKRQKEKFNQRINVSR